MLSDETGYTWTDLQSITARDGNCEEFSNSSSIIDIAYQFDSIAILLLILIQLYIVQMALVAVTL